MVDTAITKWSPNIFGQSSVRKPIRQSQAISVGVMKGVPFFVDEADIVRDLEQEGFGETTVSRITKFKNPTRSVRVYFKSPELLQKAMKDRVRSNNLTFVVEEYNMPSVIRCYNCHGYKHKASSCPNQKACFNCGGAYHGDQCSEVTNCINCKGDHRADP